MKPTFLIYLIFASILTKIHGDALKKRSVRASCGQFALEQCSFVDRFATFKKSLWIKSLGYDNGPPFNSWWAASNAYVHRRERQLQLAISRKTNYKSGLQYASGEFKSKGRYGYGCYEARIKPIVQPGVITGFFIYTDKFNAAPGRPTRINSINLGFLYQPELKRMSYRMTYTKDGVAGPIQDIYPPKRIFNSFHNYGFKFTPNSISWYFDGTMVFFAKKNIPKMSDGPFRIFLNTWIISPSAGYGGKYIFKGRGVTRIAAIRYTRGTGCGFKKFF